MRTASLSCLTACVRTSAATASTVHHEANSVNAAKSNGV